MGSGPHCAGTAPMHAPMRRPSSAGSSRRGASQRAWEEPPNPVFRGPETDGRVFFDVLETADLRACKLEDSQLQVGAHAVGRRHRCRARARAAAAAFVARPPSDTARVRPLRRSRTTTFGRCGPRSRRRSSSCSGSCVRSPSPGPGRPRPPRASTCGTSWRRSTRLTGRSSLTSGR